jgi:hypothetical protein
MFESCRAHQPPLVIHAEVANQSMRATGGKPILPSEGGLPLHSSVHAGRRVPLGPSGGESCRAHHLLPKLWCMKVTSQDALGDRATCVTRTLWPAATRLRFTWRARKQIRPQSVTMMA